MSTRTKILLGVGVWLAIGVALGAAAGSAGRNDAFTPTDEYRLAPWLGLDIKIAGIDFSVNRAVFYLLLAALITVAVMTWIASRMKARPNRVQTAVETVYVFARDNIARGNMDDGMARKWFPVIATLFIFIWVSNIIGYIPLPVNDAHPVDVLGISVPSFMIYAATANISIPLMLTLMVWFAYHVEGFRHHGFVGYFKSWIPAGVQGPAAVPIFFIEVISHFVRIISLSVRLFANILAGHLLILFMAGGLGVILGLAALGWLTLPIASVFFLFEIGLIATLQAFIFATLTAIYLGGATADHH
jgi:F-type H+-transporting ATPase subunit a